MIIFINGSINSGKSTVSSLLAKKLDAKLLELDTIRDDKFAELELEEAIPNVLEVAKAEIDKAVLENYELVANYVVNEKQWQKLTSEIDDSNIICITLSPPLEVVLQNRGNRKLSQWEVERIKYHYRIGINRPSFGARIDNSDQTPEETVKQILNMIR